MLNAANRMRVLIDDILTLSRVTSRAQPFTAVNLTGVVQEALSDLDRLLEEAQGHVEVNALPTVEGDRAQLRRVFQNLIANALKFRRRDTPPVITIAAETRTPRFGQPPICRIRVADNGIGFDEKYAERIFRIL
jgi:signal transduction histidine kinase